MDSILLSVKKVLGINPDFKAFDQDLIIHINSALSVLSQIGVGPDAGLFITGTNETWDDIIPEGKPLEMIKSYITMKVKILFDPPTGGALESANRVIDEFEWRINVAAES